MKNKNVKRQRSQSTGRFIRRGAADSSYGAAVNQNAAAPRAVANLSRKSVTPIEAYELCSHVRTAVRARNHPFQQVRIRLFLKSSGKEIIGGDLYNFAQNPNRGQTATSFLEALGCWTDLAGERDVYFGVDKQTNKVACWVWNPFALQIVDPAIPMLPEDIKKWRYIWENGQLWDNVSSDQILSELEYNPSSLVRGNSPLIAVVNSITATYEAQRFIKSYFGNQCMPSTIVNIDTENPDQVAPFVQEFRSQHQGDLNAWKTFFTYGKAVTVESLTAPVADAPFETLLENVRNEVNALYACPPLVSGTWNRSLFDSVEEQNNFFWGSVFLPKLEKIQAFYQKILCHKSIKNLANHVYATETVSKTIKQKIDKARSIVDSDVIVVLDADHIPDISHLKMKKIDYAQTLIDTFKITPQAACEEIGLDLELNDAASLVWYKSDQKSMPAKEEPKQNIEPAAPVEDSEEIVNAEESELADNTKQFFRELRTLTLKHSGNKTIWTIKEADELADKHGVKAIAKESIRISRNLLAELSKSANIEGIKESFKVLCRNSEIKKLVRNAISNN